MKDKTKSVLLCVLALVLGIIVSGVCLGVDIERENRVLIESLEMQLVEIESNIDKLEGKLKVEKNQAKAIRKFLDLQKKKP